MLFSVKRHIDVQSCFIELVITFVIHLNVAIMRYGTYYETWYLLSDTYKNVVVCISNSILLYNHIL